jgi:hypothetical protein
MRKLTFTLLLVSAIGFSGYAQKTSFGIKAGVTSNYWAFSHTESDAKLGGSKVGFYAGGIANIPLSAHLTFQPNLLVSRKGARMEEQDFTTWNIELPAHLLYTHNGFFVGAGPNFSYGLDGRLKSDDISDGESDIYSKGEVDNAFKRFEIGSSVLIGYNFPGGLTLSANYVQGLNNIITGTTDHKVKIYTSTFGFSVGYLF